MKKRRFADGGETVEMGPNPNIDDDTRERARKFVADNTAPAKSKVVTKEELAKSGLSLRDYMNKQQGLERRKEATPAPSKASAAPKTVAPEPKIGPMSEEGRAASMERIPRDKGEPAVNPITGSELGRNIKNTLNATAGLTGIQLAKAAAEGLTAPRAAATAAAAKKAELAGELRRGATPTKFTSPSKTTTAKRTRKFNEDEAGVEMKKGGKVAKYAAGGSVKGWGQARGARAAKIV